MTLPMSELLADTVRTFVGKLAVAVTILVGIAVNTVDVELVIIEVFIEDEVNTPCAVTFMTPFVDRTGEMVAVDVNI